jgi:hypothetical protein
MSNHRFRVLSAPHGRLTVLSVVAMCTLAGPLYSQDADMMSDDSMMNETGMMAEEPSFSRKDLDFFESKIRPLLLGRCVNCHSNDGSRINAGFRVDTRMQLLLGGDSGPAVIPGDPDASLLIQAIRYDDPGLEMPPRGRLTRDEIKLLEDWVSMGAPMPAPRETIDNPGTEHRWSTEEIELGRSHWAYVPVVSPEAPTIADASWPRAGLDHFVLAELEGRGLTPVGDADPDRWLRRVTFDLTGLPPTPTELDEFDSDDSPLAKEIVVDRLLTTMAFGERWGRHWLDVARYAESSGKENNVAYPHAWRYRDWVINSFNEDLPYDQFLTSQLAGDLLSAEDDNEEARNLIATGYLALGTKSHNVQGNAQFQFDLIDEQIDTITQGMLATTVACARCHDHKFDPIPQRDYYALAGIFASTETRFGTFEGPGNRNAGQLIEIPAGADLPDGPIFPSAARSLIIAARDRAENQLAAAEEIRAEMRSAGIRNLRTARDQLTPAQQQILQRARNAEGSRDIADSILNRFDSTGRPTIDNFVCMGAVEGKIRNVPFLERGELENPGNVIPRGFVQVLNSDWTTDVPQSKSGRLELADWIANEKNPLTSRVWANRIWSHLFGKGIVSSCDNFGLSGQSPSNPALLDHLATRLVELDWSSKSLIREIVLSRSYALGSEWDRQRAAKDPDETAIWRMPKRRLEAEAIRDAMLAAGGLLEIEPPIGSAASGLEGAVRENILDRFFGLTAAEYADHRSVYLPVVRGGVPEALAVFDFPEPNFVRGTRDKTNVATQALYLMNSPEITRMADAMADRVLSDKEDSKSQVELAFRIAFGRTPSAGEYIACRDFLRDFRAAWTSDNREKVASLNPTQRRQQDRRANASRRNRNDTIVATPQNADLMAFSALCQTLFQSAEFRTLD